jgi:hypothetical protein
MYAFPVAVVALLLVAYPAAAQQQRADSTASRPARNHAELSAGIQYQVGDYGTGERIESSSAVVGGRATVGRMIFSAALPYTYVDAPGNVVAGGGGLLGPIIDPTRPATRIRRRGMGDLRLGAAWILPLRGIDLAAYGQVKLPTARNGLGTGETDYAVGAEVSKGLGTVTPFANVTYVMPGSPGSYPLRNAWAGQAGLNAALGSGLSGQVAYAHAQNPSPSLSDEQLLSMRFIAGISSRLSLSAHGGAGLSKSAPDATAGVQLDLRLF